MPSRPPSSSSSSQYDFSVMINCKLELWTKKPCILQICLLVFVCLFIFGQGLILVTGKIANPIPNEEGSLIIYVATALQIAVVVLVSVQGEHNYKYHEHWVLAMGKWITNLLLSQRDGVKQVFSLCWRQKSLLSKQLATYSYWVVDSFLGVLDLKILFFAVARFSLAKGAGLNNLWTY